ncbi:MAG: hypothetical protein BWZ07_01369 [Alphaproteobacteria bacterium ADurb.BinA280]|nr:MAG: hypothetical protein BWZ07_01369 [Alphaproteobacteria bacterium ADurb.BinA280]
MNSDSASGRVLVALAAVPVKVMLYVPGATEAVLPMTRLVPSGGVSGLLPKVTDALAGASGTLSVTGWLKPRMLERSTSKLAAAGAQTL